MSLANVANGRVIHERWVQTHFTSKPPFYYKLCESLIFIFGLFPVVEILCTAWEFWQGNDDYGLVRINGNGPPTERYLAWPCEGRQLSLTLDSLLSSYVLED